MAKSLNVKTGEVLPIKCGFAVRKKYQGETNFDTDYVDITIKKVFKKTGVDENGDDIGVEVDKVVVNKRPIAEVINADAVNAGLDAYLKPFMATGELPKVSCDKEKVTDYTMMPDSLAGVLDMQAKANILFETLPSDLKGSAESIDDFFNSLSKDKLSAYLQKHAPKKVEKKAEEKPEEK